MHGYSGFAGRLVVLAVAAGTMACRVDENPTGQAQQLDALLTEIWEFELREDPLFATATGDARYNDRLSVATLEAERARAEARRGYLGRLEGIDRESLDTQRRISLDIQARDLRDAIAEFDLGGLLVPMTSDDGFHIEVAQIPAMMPFLTVADYDRYLTRLRALPDWFAQHIAVLREGLRTGVTMPRVVLDGYDVTMSSHVVDDAERSVFWTPFANLPAGVSTADADRLRAEGSAAILDAVVPAYRSLRDFFDTEYVPGARTTIGASDLPNGPEFYAHRIRRYTTLDLSADSIHRIGLAEVERIRGEMEAIIRRVGFRGDFAAFLAFLRTDPRFYARTPEQLLKEAAWIVKRMDGRLPSLFGRLPRQPYTVEAVPAHLAPKYTGGRYVNAPPGGTEPGRYWVNTFALESRPLYNLEALSLHEAVPGHHLQAALALELEGLPPIRRFIYHSAFGEGWGLYSERLGIEAGFYTDPYNDFGRLTYEMWRACRLVVDTGIHALGWTRQQVIDYLASNTALPLHEVQTETDRYISWPGQALAYKLGELTIRELRARAEQTLGARFDVRAFHYAVLANGSVPLDVLEDFIDRWIADQQAVR
ncbi:MAG: DUF885 family protein [Gemmatimonadetes bacterium]|nr:DUF885 family protein [Gemmatimonadota bacterium]